MNNCPHVLAGKKLTAGFIGTNPYIYTDFQRNVIYNDKGQPLGVNTGISSSFASMFGFELEIVFSRNENYYNNKTGKWIGITDDVSKTYLTLY